VGGRIVNVLTIGDGVTFRFLPCSVELAVGI
jgi:hypothetical protein